MRSLSLSLSGIPDGQKKGQSELPCPSVYAPTSALRSLSSVALSSAPASKTLPCTSTVMAIPHHFSKTISSTFSVEATNHLWSTFLREAIGTKARRPEPKVRRTQGLAFGKLYSNSYECLPSAILIDIAPDMPVSWSVPESGTTLIDNCCAPRFMMPVW